MFHQQKFLHEWSGDNHRHGLNGLLSYYLVVFKRKITIQIKC